MTATPAIDTAANVIAALTTAMAAMVSAPGRLHVVPQRLGHSILITAQTWKSDYSRLIGRGGQNVNALMALAEAASTAGWQFRLVLPEPTEGTLPTGQKPPASLETVVRAIVSTVPSLSTAKVEVMSVGNVANFVITSALPIPVRIKDAITTILRASAKVSNINAYLDWEEPA